MEVGDCVSDCGVSGGPPACTKLRTLLQKGFHPILPYFLGLCSFANHVGKKYGRSFGKAAYVLDYLITSVNMMSFKDNVECGIYLNLPK